MPLLLLALDPEAEPKDGTDQKRTGSATRGKRIRIFWIQIRQHAFYSWDYN